MKFRVGKFFDVVAKILVAFCGKFDEIWGIFDVMFWKFIENLGKFFAQFLIKFFILKCIKILKVKFFSS